MILIFVHGWSVTNTETYGGLPQALAESQAAKDLDLRIHHLHLGSYISFHDEVVLDDISRAFDYALRHDILGNEGEIQPFSCITHSTGGPVVRNWLKLFYEESGDLVPSPLQHLVMLAPANHGSALAVLGKGRIGRMRAWFQGVEPGQGVLDWLCLGSDGQWALNRAWAGYRYEDAGLFPFVLSGDTIDTSFYDFLNSYLVEAGSDGVVRLAGANLNYKFIRLTETGTPYPDGIMSLGFAAPLSSPATAFGVIPAASHTGATLGIMQSVQPGNALAKPVVAEILSCLSVASQTDYEARMEAQAKALPGDNQRFVMFVLSVTDDRGAAISDYDFFILGGDDFAPDQLPSGFFKDRQKNDSSGRLIYYLNYDVMASMAKIGFRIVARPDSGFARYVPVEFRSDGLDVTHFITASQTVYLDVVLTRRVDRETFRLSPADDPTGDFKGRNPSGETV